MEDTKLSKSFIWALDKVKNSDSPELSDHDWNKADEMDISAFYFGSGESDDDRVPFGKITGLRYETHYYINASVVLNIKPDDDNFNSYVIARQTHTGDYQFINQTINDAFERILYCRAYIDTKPKDGDIVHYNVGNAVVLNEEIEPKDKDKPWINHQTIVVIPMGMWVEG